MPTLFEQNQRKVHSKNPTPEARETETGVAMERSGKSTISEKLPLSRRLLTSSSVGDKFPIVDVGSVVDGGVFGSEASVEGLNVGFSVGIAVGPNVGFHVGTRVGLLVGALDRFGDGVSTVIP